MTRVRESDYPMGIDSATEIHEGVSISTDSNGDGSKNIPLDEAFSAASNYVAVPVLRGGADGDISISNKATDSAQVTITGSSTTSGSVTVDLLVVGLR